MCLATSPGDASLRARLQALSAEARHNVLYAGVVLEAVHGEVLALAGVLKSAVRHLGDEGDVGVDPDAPEVQPAADPHRPAVVPGKDARGEAVLDAVGPPHRLVQIGRASCRERV